jgi:hypothetical protein
MVLMPVLCPHCHSDHVIKGGKTKAGQQRYKGNDHTPSDYVVNSCLQRMRGSFPRDVPRIHDGRSSDQHTLTPVISTRCNFTTKSREIWNFLTGKSSTTQFAIRCNTRTPRTSPPKSPPLFLQLFLLFARCQ